MGHRARDRLGASIACNAIRCHRHVGTSIRGCAAAAKDPNDTEPTLPAAVISLQSSESQGIPWRPKLPIEVSFIDRPFPGDTKYPRIEQCSSLDMPTRRMFIGGSRHSTWLIGRARTTIRSRKGQASAAQRIKDELDLQEPIERSLGVH